ncbi:MAG: PorT family protein [Tannerella sp.]|jgi:hypothetical protein|nr:PorT family protein [Tannerella sp.]
MKKRDKWDDIIRMKSERFEMAPEPEDWDAIAKRLSRKTTNVALPGLWRYAAAVAALLVLATGGYYAFMRLPAQPDPPVAEVKSGVKPVAVPETPDAAVGRPPDTTPAVAVRTVKRLPSAVQGMPVSQDAERIAVPEEQEQPFMAESGVQEPARKTDDYSRTEPTPEYDMHVDGNPLMTDAMPPKSRRRWVFGVGGGGYSIGNAGAGNLVYSIEQAGLGSLTADFENVLALSEMRAYTETKQNVSHRRPLSFGVGIGYALSDRWTLQSGLAYSMLTSRWDVKSVNSGKANQQLHFVGIPLAVNYRIAEWNRFRLYALAGGTAEWNVVGRIKTKYYDDAGNFDGMKTESVRMKESQFSVNGRVGVNYPLLRFMHAYLEGGADYYFKNGSSIETIRSNKPFQLSLQAGIRFGF